VFEQERQCDTLEPGRVVEHLNLHYWRLGHGLSSLFLDHLGETLDQVDNAI
jgi:hypothetical protein